MDVTRNDDGTVTMGFDTEEFLAITQSFGWLCRGLNRLRGAQFVEHLGAAEEEVDALADRLRAARPEAEGVTLDASDIAVISRALSEILVGPAAVPSASGGEPDWELLGGVSADRFAAVRSEISALAE